MSGDDDNADNGPGSFVRRTLPPEPLKEFRAEALGYRRPPKHSQFQKGQSGNPKGRPKRAKLVDDEGVAPIISSILHDLIGQAMERPVRVRKNGELVEMPTEEALVEKLREQAALGNVAATRYLLDQNQQRRATQAAEAAEDFAFWSRYKSRLDAERAVARQWGEPDPPSKVDPDDIILGPGHKVRLIGPYGDDEKASYAKRVRIRDFHQAYLGRSIWKWHNQRPKPKGDMPFFLSMLVYLAVEAQLPPRMQTADLFAVWSEGQLNIGGKQSYKNLMRAAYEAGEPIPDHRFHHDHVIPREVAELAMKHKMPALLLLETFLSAHIILAQDRGKHLPLPTEILDKADAMRRIWEQYSATSL